MRLFTSSFGINANLAASRATVGDSKSARKGASIPSSYRTRAITWIFGMLWVIALAAGIHASTAYAYRPGPQAAAPGRWPGATAVVPARGRSLRNARW